MSRNEIIDLQNKIEELQSELALFAVSCMEKNQIKRLQRLAAQIDNKCQHMYLSSLRVPLEQRPMYLSSNPYI